jgi:hypothetical protein
MIHSVTLRVRKTKVLGQKRDESLLHRYLAAYIINPGNFETKYLTCI